MRKRLFLVFVFCFIAIYCTKGFSQEASELLDNEYYSAGKMSSNEINQWFDKNINEDNFDIWFGKKMRQYLLGAWRFRRIDLPVTNVDVAPGSNTVPVSESDYGELNGFHKSDYDDSAWPFQPVPYAWIYKFNPNDSECKESYVKGGNPYAKDGRRVNLGWYRRKFSIPDTWKNKLILLNFNAVTWRASVYVNGVKIGEHEESRKPIHWIGSSRTEERFTLDITSALKFDGENSLAVKVFAPCPNGGIWQEVFLEAVPEIYITKALVTPELESNSIKIKAYIINTKNDDQAIEPQAEINPWQSTRYKPLFSEKQITPLSKQTLFPGENEVEWRVSIKAPRFWSPEHPQLYHLILKNQEGAIIGQERFGFRDFKVGRKYFQLNDKPILLRGENCSPCSWFLPGNSRLIIAMGLLNPSGKFEYMLRKYSDAGFNIVRSNGTYPPHVMYEIADEIGLMIYEDEADWRRHQGVIRNEKNTVELTDRFAESIKQRCWHSYNNPSLVIRSCGNELFDTRTGELEPWKKSGWAPLIDAIYDEYKKYDSTRPMCASSVRGPKDPNLFYFKTWAKTKGDFDDCHPYVTDRTLKAAEFDHPNVSYARFKMAYTNDNDGVERAMLDGESSEFLTWVNGGAGRNLKARCDDFIPNIKNGAFDRKWLAGNLQKVDPKYMSEACEYSLVPFVDSVDRNSCYRVQAWHNQQLMEMARRRRDVLAGYIYHMPSIMKDFSFGETNPYTFESAKKTQQPILACLSGFFNRNVIAGSTASTTLYLINDTENVLTKPNITITISNGNVNNECVLGAEIFEQVDIAGMVTRKIKINIPADWASGRATLNLTVNCGKNIVSINNYDCYILNPKDIVLTGESKQTKVAILGSSCSDLSSFLNTLAMLKISYCVLNDINELDEKIEVAILPPQSELHENERQKIHEWIVNGGKFLSFEQKEHPFKIQEGNDISPPGYFGYWTELVLPSHPVFSGLTQDDFRFWSGNETSYKSYRLVDAWLSPLREGVLAMGMSVGNRMGMSACEEKLGKGRFFISQLKSLERFGEDSIATKYTVNLFNYVLSGFNDPRAPMCDKIKSAATYTVDPAKTFSVDLKPYANMGFKDDIAHDQIGGWSDQGSENDASFLPTGKQVFAGVPFEIIDPSKNAEKSCIVLRGSQMSKTSFLPLAQKGIKVDRFAKRLFFLVASCWTPKDTQIANIKINMNVITGGTVSMNELPLHSSKNISDWWRVVTVPEALVGWTHLAGKSDQMREVGIYVVEWINPEPIAKVDSIDFLSEGKAVPILIGITGE